MDVVAVVGVSVDVVDVNKIMMYADVKVYVDVGVHVSINI